MLCFPLYLLPSQQVQLTIALKKNTRKITVSDITSADKLIFQKHNNFVFFVFFFP